MLLVFIKVNGIQAQFVFLDDAINAAVAGLPSSLVGIAA